MKTWYNSAYQTDLVAIHNPSLVFIATHNQKTEGFAVRFSPPPATSGWREAPYCTWAVLETAAIKTLLREVK